MSVINIENMRKERGFTQADMAAALNVQQSTISMWETGKSKPRTEMLLTIAKYLGCTVNELFEPQEQTN